MESLFIEIINEKNTNIIVGVIYRAPDSDIKCFLESITEITEKISHYLLADFYINLLNVNGLNIGKFLYIISSFFFLNR